MRNREDGLTFIRQFDQILEHLLCLSVVERRLASFDGNRQSITDSSHPQCSRCVHDNDVPSRTGVTVKDSTNRVRAFDWTVDLQHHKRAFFDTEIFGDQLRSANLFTDDLGNVGDATV